MLKPNEVKGFRERLWRAQGRKCPLCGKYIPKEQLTLDHDHGTGYVRASLHRNCNSIEGRILSFAKRTKTDPVRFIRALLAYWEADYSHHPIHPNQTREIQKQVKALNRRIRQAKKKETKDRLREEIKKVKESLK